ncbi:MAG: rod shape-determining protein RodA [Bacteroidales bacterium]|nr:rod shape-determining protein RodA [Bacteroidales bacterium]
MKEQKGIFKFIDRPLVLLYLTLVLMGWISIYAAVYNNEHASIFDLSQSYGKQLLWIVTALAIALMIMLTDAKFFNAFAYPIYIGTILLLVIVLFAGKEIAGSKSWFQIGEFRIQPAEFAKFATNLALAHFLSALDFDSRKRKSQIIPLIILAIPALLILLQNDTGSAIVYSSLALVLYRQGMPGSILLLGVAVAILAIMALMFNQYIVITGVGILLIGFTFFIRRNWQNIVKVIGIFVVASLFVLSVDYAFQNVLELHQKTRINVLLGKQIDLKGAGYNVNQSKIAIGSGGFWGKGFLKGTQTKFNFVPEQSTDFIFCTVGEEWGFVGSTVVMLLFLALIVRILMMAERQRSDFSRIYGYGVASILFFHFFVNVGMTIGLMPVIGIPLPFFSYGGSSLWAFTILLFIFIKMDSNRLQLV